MYLTAADSTAMRTIRARAEFAHNARAAQHASAPDVGATFLANFVMGRLWDLSLGPLVRQAVDGALGRPPTAAPPAPPDTRPGTFARSLVIGAINFGVGSHMLRQLTPQLLPGIGPSLAAAGQKLLTTTGGVAAATARITGNSITGLLGTTLVMSTVFTLLDELTGRLVGPEVERGVNNLLGVPERAPDPAKPPPGPPSGQQLARNFARSVFGGLVFAAAHGLVGKPLHLAVHALAPSAAGALAGAIVAGLSTTAIAGVVDAAIGGHVAHGAQEAWRLVEGLITGESPDPIAASDLAATAGDRVSGTLGSFAVGIGTNHLVGTSREFYAALTPVRR